MTRGRLLFSLISALTAPLLLVQGLANAELSPAPVSWNGFWQAKIALNYLRVEQVDGQLNMSIREGGSDLARDAFAKEPLASDSLFLLAVDFRAQDNLEAFDQVLSAGATLDKRNRNIGAMQLEQAAIVGNMVETFAILDRLAITNPRLTGDFVQPLTRALEDESSLELFRQTLAHDPAWSRSFWESIPSSEGAIMNMYELRLVTGAGTTEDTDSRLLAGLARVGLYEEAIDFWSELSGSEADPFAFMPTSDFPPIGWLAVSSGERSFLPRGINQFDIYVADQTFGELARQLVRLEPGGYSLSARVAPANEAENVEATLRCATNNGGDLNVMGMDSVVEWAVDDSCEIYWLVLSASAWGRRTPLRAEISEIAFRRAD